MGQHDVLSPFNIINCRFVRKYVFTKEYIIAYHIQVIRVNFRDFPAEREYLYNAFSCGMKLPRSSII